MGERDKKGAEGGGSHKGPDALICLYGNTNGGQEGGEGGMLVWVVLCVCFAQHGVCFFFGWGKREEGVLVLVVGVLLCVCLVRHGVIFIFE